MDQIGINGWNFIVQLIAFLVFAGLLWKYAVGPITSVLDKRQQTISESLKAAERMQAELRDTQTRNEQALAEARREAQVLITDARASAEQLEAKARERAEAQAGEFLDRARQTLRQETLQARQQLRQEVADIAVSAAGKIIRKEIDPQAQRSLIEETLNQAGQAEVRH